MATRKKPIPVGDQELKVLPNTQQVDKELPSTKIADKAVPDAKQEKKKLPPIGNPENTVMIGEQLIEIKPTKVGYQRNRTAAFYRALELYPLTDILGAEPGQFGDERDGDKSLMDWLIAVTDNEELITANYDDLDTETIEKMLVIFKRVNKITDKEEKLKNLERVAKTKA